MYANLCFVSITISFKKLPDSEATDHRSNLISSLPLIESYTTTFSDPAMAG